MPHERQREGVRETGREGDRGDGGNIAGKWQTDEASAGLESYLRRAHTHTVEIHSTYIVYIYNI